MPVHALCAQISGSSQPVRWVVDRATSDDPLMAQLQRCGWNLGRVRQLQASIAKKMTPDMFTGKTEDLSVAEYTLQQHIEAFWKAQRGMRK